MVDYKKEKKDDTKEIIEQILKVSAHQLRSPITTIQTLLKTVLTGYAGEVPGKIKRLIEGAYKKSGDMLTLINDLLELAKFQEKNIRKLFEPINLEELFQKIVESLKEKIETKKIEFVVEKDEILPIIWAYRIGIEHILYNLLENAIKYTPNNGRVLIKLNYDETKKILSGEVSDSGIGIPKEYQKYIFTEFYRAPNAKQEEKTGTGLGLVIVKKAVEIHNGKISFESSPEKGTSFKFILPATKIAKEKIRKEDKSDESKRLKILIIGGKAAGPKAAAKARRMDEDALITLIEKEEVLSYAGCGLPFYISNMVTDARLLMTTNDGDIRDPEFFKKIKDIEVLINTEAIEIDRANKRVKIRNLKTLEETTINYDKLIIATGSIPIVPKIPGIDKKGVYTLYSVADAEGLKRELNVPKAKDVYIIGGGAIGVEVSEALVRRGARVTIIEIKDQLLNFLDLEFSELVKNHLERKGIKILLNTKVEEIIGDERVSGIKINDKILPADLIIVAIGVRPNVELAKKSGLEIGETGGIKINEYLQTNDENIYAIGDCVENKNLITGKPIYTPLGSIANKQGRIAGLNVTGAKEKFSGVLQTIILKVFDYNIGAVGLNEKTAKEQSFEPLTVIVPGPDKEHYYPTAELIYLKLIADKKTGKLLGAQAIGKGDISKRIDIVATAISANMLIWDLSKLDLAYAPPFSAAMDILITAANVLKNKYYGNFEGISPIELKERLLKKDDILLIDVRTPAEYDIISISNSILIPLNSLRGRLYTLPKEKEIILICRTGINSYEAYKLLKANNFKKVKVLEGGIVTYFGEL
ncbi:MAG TPA: FAD-dependent oxidoreductase [bacterium]|mgnify:CR=1 FL=1|nr:FAD-dependent oxidoreductase [bacterium]HOL46910.1 FAD-dependent oxidoreductase [bacterium]HPQ18328.1 FAD-dependent oxidoreductase [bacterium]